MMTQALTEEQKASVQEVINQAIQKQQKIGEKLSDFLILFFTPSSISYYSRKTREW